SNQVSINTGYDIMTSLVKNLLTDYTNKVQAYEIVGSYCPGDYDLSINGVKFAGISQRRVKNGSSIKIYLDINGHSNTRVNLVKNLLTDYTNKVQAYEIVGSYCSGDYDLSINGVKFAGISQRRVKNGISIQIYLDINGHSNTRANLIKDFYSISLNNTETTIKYPEVDPSVMGSLSSILNKEITDQDILTRLTQLINRYTTSLTKDHFRQTELTQFHKRIEQMHKRNEKIRP